MDVVYSTEVAAAAISNGSAAAKADTRCYVDVWCSRRRSARSRFDGARALVRGGGRAGTGPKNQRWRRRPPPLDDRTTCARENAPLSGPPDHVAEPVVIVTTWSPRNLIRGRRDCDLLERQDVILGWVSCPTRLACTTCKSSFLLFFLVSFFFRSQASMTKSRSSPVFRDRVCWSKIAFRRHQIQN